MRIVTDKDWKELDEEELGSAILDKVDSYYRYLQETGLFALWQLSYQRYYNPYYTGGIIQKTGNVGQYRKISVNQYRSIVDATFSLITNEKIALKTRAANTDSDTEKAAILGDQLLEFYFPYKGIEKRNRKAALLGLICAEGFTLQMWEKTAGEPFVGEDGQVITSGDVDVRTLTPLDVIRDPFTNSFDESEWFICRLIENKFTLATRFPQFREEILGQSGSFQSGQGDSASSMPFFFDDAYRVQSNNANNIYIYVFLHKDIQNRIPNGMLTFVLGDGTVIYNGDLPYEGVPLERFTPMDGVHGPFGHSPMFDLLAPQQNYNTLFSVLNTNQSRFGVQSIWCREQDQLKLTRLDEGLSTITTKDTPPQALQLTATSPEIPQHINRLELVMEKLSGANSVVRGQPTPNLDTGIAIAQVQAAAVQYNSPAIESWVRMNEGTGYTLLSILRNHANTERVVEIAGEGERYALKSFKGSDLKGISRVTVSLINPLMWGPAGKSAMLEQYTNLGLIKTPEHVQEVMQTGNLTPLFDAPMKEITRIRLDCEELRNGKPVTPLRTDNPILSIREIKTLLDEPEIRRNPEQVSLVLSTITQYEDILMNATPIDYAVWGIDPAQFAGMQQGTAQALLEPGLTAEPPAPPEVQIPPGTSPQAAEIISNQQVPTEGVPIA